MNGTFLSKLLSKICSQYWQSELELLVELAQRYEEITVQRQEDDVTTEDLMRLSEESGAFDFWQEEGEDIYSSKDGEPV